MRLGSESALKQREACQLFLARAWPHVASQLLCLINFRAEDGASQEMKQFFCDSGLADSFGAIAAGGSGKAFQPK